MMPALTARAFFATVFFGIALSPMIQKRDTDDRTFDPFNRIENADHPDMSALDTFEDWVSEAVSQYHADLPQTRADFKMAVLSIVRQASKRGSCEPDTPDLEREDVRREVGELVWSKLVIVFSEIMDHEKARLTLDALAHAGGLYLRMGISATELAKRHGISKEAFCKRVETLRLRLGLPVSRAMKSEAAREKYKLTNWRSKNGNSHNSHNRASAN